MPLFRALPDAIPFWLNRRLRPLTFFLVIFFLAALMFFSPLSTVLPREASKYLPYGTTTESLSDVLFPVTDTSSEDLSGWISENHTTMRALLRCLESSDCRPNQDKGACGAPCCPELFTCIHPPSVSRFSWLLPFPIGSSGWEWWRTDVVSIISIPYIYSVILLSTSGRGPRCVVVIAPHPLSVLICFVLDSCSA
jgi:hypothetical protein